VAAVSLLFVAASSAFTPPRSHVAPPEIRDREAASSRQQSSLFMNKKKKKPSKSSGSKGFGGGSSASSAVSSDGTTLIKPKIPSNFRYAGTITAGLQTPKRMVPDGRVTFPDYAVDGQPKNRPALFPWVIETKKPEEIEKMRAAGRCAREVLDLAGREIRPGITTDEIDRIVHEASVSRGAYPSPLNYHNFPKSCCTSVNEVICHGIPDNRPLGEGDIVNLDITCYLNGYHGDCSEMFVVGGEDAIDSKGRKLLQATYDCWVKALNFVKPGNDYKDIGAIIEDHVTDKGFTTVKSFCGHGIGSVFHTNPNILHYRNSEPAGKMAPGHTFTIEPMICEGDNSFLMWPDDWTATTRDGGRSAQFEHTLLITPDGVEALTGKIETSPVQFWERDSKVHNGVWIGTSAAGKEREAALNASLLGSS
jgi:methionyl aminopeptidase